MVDPSKELFYFHVIKPNYSFLISILSDGALKVGEKVSGNKHETEKQISETEIKAFFAELEKLGLYSWPPNLDCCACDDSSWTVMADYEGRKKRCFGVFGFEPDTWPDLIKLVEECIDKKLQC